jgi:protein SCO1/2
MNIELKWKSFRPFAKSIFERGLIGNGRDAALRRPRPRAADGIASQSRSVEFPVAPLNAARTTQRAVPTRLRRCRILASVIASLLLANFNTTASTPDSSLTDDDLRRVQFEQKPGNPVSPELVFRDENGKEITLGNYFGRKPVILVLGYYECPMLCSLTFNGLIESLQDLKFNPGADYEVVNVSIDPKEAPALASAKKANYLKRYARPGAAAGWHFLTGDVPAIERLANDVGFHYAYDERIRQFAHPGGFVILTPDGKVSKYFLGVKFSAKEISDALREAGAGKTGSPAQEFFLLCFHYSPISGKYGPLIMTIVRACGATTLVVLGSLIAPGIHSWRRKSKARS